MSSGESNNGLSVVIISMQTVFIILKLTKVIDWSWRWVLSPFWVSTLIVLAIVAYIHIRY